MSNVVSRSLQITLALAWAGLTAACSTPVPSAPTTTAAAAEDADKTTGSHLQRPSTYHMVRRIGSSGAREMMRDLPPNPGPPIQ